ncbi:MAG: hypothetical protein ACREEB_12490 [Caulobacteraceae bacterium]
MKRGGPFLALAALAALSTWPVVAQTTQISPHWGSDRIRSARPVVPESVIEFDLKTETLAEKQATTVTTSVVILAPTYDYVTQGPQRVLDDYSLCRTLVWSDAKPILDNSSCFVQPAFFGLEIRNRQYLAGLMSNLTGGSKGAVVPPNPYWAEAELRVQVEPKAILAVRRAGDATEYRLGDQVVARVIGSATKLSDEERHEVARYFARFQPLHPQIRDDLGDSLPSRLEIQTMEAFKKEWQILIISNVRRTTLAYPLPIGLTSSLMSPMAPPDALHARGVQASILAIDGHSATTKPSLKSIVDGMRDASAKGRQVEVVLRLLELTQLYASSLQSAGAGSIVNEVRPLFQSALRDPYGAKLWAINAMAGDSKAPGDREAAARDLTDAKVFDSMPFGTFHYVIFANLVRESDTAKWDPSIFKRMPSPLVDNYWAHIVAFPWASNAYKDAGDTYLADYDTENAWVAYDLGRAVDRDWRSGVMANVAQFEDELRKGEPDFF